MAWRIRIAVAAAGGLAIVLSIFPLAVTGAGTGVVSGAAPHTIEDTYRDHARAVELARGGDHAAGLRILDGLLRRFPDDYPLNRDFIVIATWQGDCDAALARYARVRRQPRFEPYLARALRDCAVVHARQGRHAPALVVLEELAARDPDNAPLLADVVAIHAWRPDCPAAIARYEPLRGREPLDAWFVIPVADCLIALDRPREAAGLTRAALERAPEDERLQHLLEKARGGLPAAERGDPYSALVFEAAMDESDQGTREWLSWLKVSAPVSTRTRVFARYLLTRSDAAELRAGDMDRAGIGLHHRFDERWAASLEGSTDVRESGKPGAQAEFHFRPRDTWQFSGSYSTFAEDLPLHARAVAVEASRRRLSAEYGSIDHIWYWRGTGNAYEFSDGNDRRSLYTTVGFAYHMLPYREQRVYGEWYQSRNTLDGAPYFNPKRDHSLGIVHRTDFIFQTSYRRHVDSLFVRLSAYDQDDFGTHMSWGVRYEQDYEFDNFRALRWGAGYARNVYDGLPEGEMRLDLRYVWRF